MLIDVPTEAQASCKLSMTYSHYYLAFDERWNSEVLGLW